VELKMEKGLTDYEMQIELEKRGHKLYFPELDNQVDNEELARLAIKYKFRWDDEKELWFSE